jgi:hypothetical protein
VLVRADAANDSVEVPMGSYKGSMPARLVHDLAAAEPALTEFLKNPGASVLGPEWATGREAGATRLSTC